MTKHTEKTGPLPNASIDFDKVQANAKAGKDVFTDALSNERETDPVKINKAHEEAQKQRAKDAEAAADETGTAGVTAEQIHGDANSADAGKK